MALLVHCVHCPFDWLSFVPVLGRIEYLYILTVPYVPAKQQVQSLAKYFGFRIVQWKSIKALIWLMLKMVKYIDGLGPKSILTLYRFIYLQIEHKVFCIQIELTYPVLIFTALSLISVLAIQPQPFKQYWSILKYKNLLNFFSKMPLELQKLRWSQTGAKATLFTE